MPDADSPDLHGKQGGIEELLFFREYHQRKPQYERLLAQLLSLFEEYRRSRDGDAKLRVHSVRGRIKSPISLLRKVQQTLNLTKLGAAAFSAVPDIVGARLVCNTLEGKAAACAWLEEQTRLRPPPFTISLSKEIEYASGYRSRHYHISLTNEAWPTLRVVPGDRDETVKIEVQIRTILEEAWGEIEHDLVYKGDQGVHLDTKDLLLKPGFKALSHRLHDADILVHGLTKRIVDKPTPQNVAVVVAKQQRSLELDVTRLGVDGEAAMKDLDGRLSEAEAHRLKGDNAAAYDLHLSLLNDKRYSNPSTQRVLFSELGLDRLIQTKTAFCEGASNAEASRLLHQAGEHYDSAIKIDPTGNNVIVFYRQSEVAILQRRFEEAHTLLESSLDLFNKVGAPAYLRTRFYKARLRSKLAALDLNRYGRMIRATSTSEADLQSVLEEAGKHLWDAKGDHLLQRSETDPQTQDWMRDGLTIYNNLAWYLYLIKDYQQARSVIETARTEIEASIWERDIHFLGTILAVELALLPDRPSFDELTWLDSLRIRILNILQMGGSLLFRETAASMLERIATFEKRWHTIALDLVTDLHMGKPTA